MTKTRKTYSQDFRIKAVELCNQRGNITEVAAELNLKWDTLNRWKKKYKTGKLNATGAIIKTKEEIEITRLRKALSEAQMERDILKKAVGIFTKNDL
jgi:transposase